MSSWEHLYAALPISKVLSIPPPSAPDSETISLEQRPIIGSLPGSLSTMAPSLRRERAGFVMPPDVFVPVLRERTAAETLSSPPSLEASIPAEIPKVATDSCRPCESRGTLFIEKQDVRLGRAPLETLNGRLLVRSKIQLTQHSCNLDHAKVRIEVRELFGNRTTTDLILLDAALRQSPEQGDIRPVSGATLPAAGAVPIANEICGSERKIQARKLIGSRLRIPLPELKQPG